jgi:copper chaperone CopZ
MDRPTIQRRYVVRGMSCAHCETAVRDELIRLATVTEVVVDAAAGTVTIDSTAPLDVAAIAAAVDDAGYELVR